MNDWSYKSIAYKQLKKFCGSVVMVVVDLLFIVTPIVGVCNYSMFCCTLLYVHSSFAIILMGKRELVALLGLSSWCLVIGVWLFLAVPWVCLQYFLIILTYYFCAYLKKDGCSTIVLHSYGPKV